MGYILGVQLSFYGFIRYISKRAGNSTGLLDMGN